MIESKIIFPFRTVSLSDAKKKFTEIIDEVRKGEQIGITRRGKVAAIITPAHSRTSLKRIFREIEELRKRTRPHKSIKDFIQEGRV
jgi:prevent-host-death family protein